MRGEMKLNARAFAVAAAALVAVAAPSLAAQPVSGPVPLYKDTRQPVDTRIEDLLRRMTLEEKVAQLETVWEHKDKIQTNDGGFSSNNASRNFAAGIGQIARPSDRRGVTASSGAAGAAAASHGRDARETADYINAAQPWAGERTRLGLPPHLHRRH